MAVVTPLLILRSPAISGRASVPGSKSVTNRALVCAALAEGRSVIAGGLEGDDADSMIAGLRSLGASISEDFSAGAPLFVVEGTCGRLAEGEIVVDAGLAGTTFRFLVALSALAPGTVTVTGRPPLLSRPIGPLLTVLRQLGVRLQVEQAPDGGERGPVRLLGRGGRLGGRVAIEAGSSSQFVTALLLVAPYLDDGLTVEPVGLRSAGFVDLTTEVMDSFGVSVAFHDGCYAVAPGHYRGVEYAVPPDASAASHLLTLAMATRGEVRIDRLTTAASQPDFAVLGVFEQFGGSSLEVEGDVVLRAPERLAAVEVDLSSMPDQLSNVAVLAALADGVSHLAGVGITRHHETDRIAAVAQELAKVGVRCDEGEDELVVHGGSAGGTALFSSHDDHRLAMSLAALAAALGDCGIEDPDAVSKTYRHFWRDASALGLVLSPGR